MRNQGFENKRHVVEMEGGEKRYFPSERLKKEFEAKRRLMAMLDRNMPKNTGSPFHGEED